MANKRVTLTDQTENDLGFITLTAGIDLTRFKKNPVMLDYHERKSVIGKWANIQVEADGSITAEPVFNLSQPLGKQRAQEFEDGFMNGASIGAMPIEFELDGSKFGFAKDTLVLTKSKLNEASLCALPCNENALTLYDKGGNLITLDKFAELKLSLGVSTQPVKPQTPNMFDKKFIALALGLAVDADDTAVNTAFQTVVNEHRTLKTVNLALQAKVDAFETSQIESTIQLAVEQKKITAAQKPMYIELAKKDFAGVQTLLNSIPAVVNLATGSVDTQTVKDTTDRGAWSFNDWSQKDEKGLQLMMTEDKARFEALYEKQFGSKPSTK